MHYYHVDSSHPKYKKALLSVGQKLRIANGEHNFFYRKLFEFKSAFAGSMFNPNTAEVEEQAIPLRWLFNSLDGEEVSTNPIHEYFIREAAHNLKNSEITFFQGQILTYADLTRELIFENTRLEYHPSLPSRLKCLWLASDLDSSKYWRGRLEKNSETQIIRVKAEGKIFSCDAGHLLAHDEVKSISIAARKYWAGEPYTAKPEREVLLEGEIEVVGIESC